MDYKKDLLFIIIFIVIYIIINKNILNNENSKSENEIYYDIIYNTSKNDSKSLSLKDVCGCEETKIQINDVIDYIKNPELYINMGAKLPKGILLEGKPGTGKTLMIKALSNECSIPVITVYVSNLCDTYVGVGAQRVRNIFLKARKLSPCIVFFDEIDSIGTMRDYSSNSNSERVVTLNAILNEIDGFNNLENVIVIAATNKADKLDPALVRPGRFDKKITVNLPDRKDREDLFKYYLSKVKTIEDINLVSNEFSNLTSGFSGAEIANIVNESAIIAVRNKNNNVTKKDINEAYEIHILGLKKIRGNLSFYEERIVAFHEAGHAFLQSVLKYVSQVSRVSIEPRVKSALGYSQSEPDEKNLNSKQEIIHQISILLGGRIVESIVNDNLVTTGAYDDLKKINILLKNYVQIFGFDKQHGRLVISDSNDKQNTSDMLSYEIEQHCRRILKDIELETYNIIRTNFNYIQEIAGLLIKNKNIYNDDLSKIIGDELIDSYEIIID